MPNAREKLAGNSKSLITECTDGECQCKANVEGRNCDRCRQGTYGLQEMNPLGCNSCWCSGVTTECSAASMYWSTLRWRFLDEDHGLTLIEP